MVASETDAFKLAERDRKVRGDKALLGEKASKLHKFAWADPALDRETLIRARQVVTDMLIEDPRLHRKIYRELVEELGITIAEGGQRRRRGGGGKSTPDKKGSGGDRQSSRGDSTEKSSSNKGRPRRKRGRSRRRSN
jgi:hypothetical protein